MHVNMCVCRHVHACVHECLYRCVCVHAHIHMHVHTHVHARAAHTCTHTLMCTCAHMHRHGCVHVHTHARVHTHTRACAHVHVHGCAHARAFWMCSWKFCSSSGVSSKAGAGPGLWCVAPDSRTPFKPSSPKHANQVRGDNCWDRGKGSLTLTFTLVWVTLNSRTQLSLTGWTAQHGQQHVTADAV